MIKNSIKKSKIHRLTTCFGMVFVYKTWGTVCHLLRIGAQRNKSYTSHRSFFTGKKVLSDALTNLTPPVIGCVSITSCKYDPLQIFLQIFDLHLMP